MNQHKESDQLIQVVHTWTLLVLMERKDDMLDDILAGEIVVLYVDDDVAGGEE